MGRPESDETTPFLGGKVVDKQTGLKRFAKGAVVVASVAGAFVALNSKSSTSSISLIETDTEMKLLVSNQYTATQGHPATDYTWLEEGKLVEPYKTTVFSVAHLPEEYDASTLTSTCKASHSSSDEVIEETSTSVDCSLVFTKPGDYHVETKVLYDDLVVASLTIDVVSRYVRRDIRKLSSDDLASVMDAMHTIYTVSDADGVTTYGDGYRSISHFVELHLANSVPDKQHDYMHDGMGFLSQHIAITNEFEQALQVVDPSVSMPYWDFTQDFVQVREMAKAEGRAVQYSDLWSLDVWGEDYFGSSAGSKLHTVTEGRWAYMQVPKTTSKNSLNANAFGFLRAPWNLQTSPYVTRYHTLCGMSIGGSDSYLTNQWPTCKEHYSAVFDLDAYAAFVPYMAYVAHAGVHLMIGGAGSTAGSTGSSCSDWASELDGVISSDNLKMIKSQSSFLLRNIWRYDLCTAPSSSDCEGSVIDGSSSSCKMTCAGCENDEFTDDQLTALTQWFSADVVKDVTSDQLQTIARTVFCDSKLVVGEHVEASSPIDHSFWSMHPTLERLMQYKQLVYPFTDYTWDASTYQSDWTSECKWGATFSTDCTGHGESDLTAGKMTVLDESSGLFVSKYLSNQAIMELSKPDMTSSLPYVYDSFDYSHCEAEGITFEKIPQSN